jgi:hypothetical protein
MQEAGGRKRDMANDFGSGIEVQRTAAGTWTVYKNGVSMGGFASRRLAHSTAAGLVSNAAATERFGNLKAATGEVQVITLTDFAGTDSFSLKLGQLETVPFVRGTNATAAAMQTALRTLTGDSTLTVTGTTDEGPFTVTWVSQTVRQPLFQQGTVSACTLASAVTVTGGVAL